MTDFGFRWGPMLVERLAHFKPRAERECYVLGVSTNRHQVEVYSSKTGRSLRVWLDGKELT